MSTDYWKQYFRSTALSDNPHRKVGRTVNKQPISEEHFDAIINDISEKLALGADDVLLDLCCGNGSISNRLAPLCKTVTGVDFTEELIDDLRRNKQHANITEQVGDVNELQFDPAAFDKILLYFSLQHFSHAQATRLLLSAVQWLKPGGRFLIGDIPDSARTWNFFNTPEREAIYFDGLKNEQPVIGVWYDKMFMEKLAHYAGFSECKIYDQPEGFFNAHYRFDVLLTK